MYTFNSLPSTFPYTNSTGGDPIAGLVQGSDGNFYGVTLYGGANGNGVVFKLTTGGVQTVLHVFSATDAQGRNTDGASPWGTLIQASDGNFYGTAAFGGSAGYGVVFKITSGGTFTTLHSFSGTDGANPRAGIIQGSDGNFYGTAEDGGAGGAGTVFKLTSGGTLTTLYSFSAEDLKMDNTDGANPRGGLVEGSSGVFYGTTLWAGGAAINDGTGRGTIFSITSIGAFSVLYHFIGSGEPYSGLTNGHDGYFYGTALHGGVNTGSIYKITPSGVFTTLHNFAGGRNTGLDGLAPWGGLLLASDGSFYGTTLEGGAGRPGYGTIFKITSSGTFTLLHSFQGPNSSEGINPSGTLIQGSDGHLYGTTQTNGPSGGSTVGGGTVFRFN